MAVRGVDFKWYDGFLLLILVISAILVAIDWKQYHICTYPLHMWKLVDYTTIFVFRVLMFVDDGLAAGMGLDFGWQRFARFCGRVALLSTLYLLLYPFLWGWTVIGTLWYTKTKNCIVDGPKWTFLLWLLFNYHGLGCVGLVCLRKWLARRQAYMVRAHEGTSISEFGILVDMIRVPEWAFEAAGQEMRGMGQDAATYHPGHYLTPAQREAVEVLIQNLPKFRLKAVPTDCDECPICLEEFLIGDEVRGLPCTHNFHVECIDQWLQLNVKCPRCRCSVFSNLDLSALSNIRPESQRERSSSTVVTTTHNVRAQIPSRSYRLRLQGLLRPVRSFNGGGSGNELESVREVADNDRPGPSNRGPEHIVDVPSSATTH